MRGYHMFRSYGIPESNIIVMFYDDIANSTHNPTPGIVINERGGPDLYKGVPKDYTGKEVTPENFLAVMQGDPELAKQGKKVVNSGPNDHVFIYFGDHGSTEMLMFPSTYLKASDLNKALVSMHEKHRFAELAIYIDACESGSMFRNILADNIKVYATSSSDYNELSWFWNWDDKYDTWLSSFFADNWLDNDETSDLKTETMQQQFQFFKEHNLVNYTHLNVTHSVHSQQYGSKPNGVINRRKAEQNNEAVSKWDAKLVSLEKRIEKTEDINEENRLLAELENLYAGRKYVDKHMTEYVNSIQHLLTVDSNAILNTKQELNDRQCYETLVDTYNENCLQISKLLVREIDSAPVGTGIGVCD
ncbi:unnamed protein product, partial [Medioppia subpectinata]